MPTEWMFSSGLLVAGVVVFVLVAVPLIVSSFLRNVEAGTIRMVSWLTGGTVIYRGPGKSKEIPLLTIGTTLSSKVINVDLDITDQTADIDEDGVPRPIKVQVLASAIVSVGDTDVLIKTAANRFFSKHEADQINTLTDLLSSSGRRAINLLTHDQLFSARSTPSASRSLMPDGSGNLPAPRTAAAVVAHASDPGTEDEDDPLAVIIRKACSRELTDLGLIFNSLNIKIVRSEVAEARRRQSAAEAQANAEIVSAIQARRAKEAQLDAERAISDKQRELEQTKASNAALIAQAEAKRQETAGLQRSAELDATQIAQARADAARVRLEAEASADAEAIRIRRVADATAESIQKVNQAIQAGGEAYFRYRQIEMLPQIAPAIAEALAEAKMVTISSGEVGAPETTSNNITSVIQTVLAAQMVAKTGILDPGEGEEEALIIRDATPADAARIAELSGILGYPNSTAAIAERLKRLLPKAGELVLVADQLPPVMGWVHAQEQELLDSGRRCEILGLVVAPEVRGRGVGRQLVAAVEEWAAQRGLVQLAVRSNIVRTESHPFYERLGFVKLKTQHAYRKQLA